MDKNEKPKIRHKELSLMFVKMGQALVAEGLENKDYVVALVGNNMIFMGSLIFNKGDVRLFGELCSMVSSKRLINEVTNGKIDFSGLTKENLHKDIFDEIKKKIDRDFEDLNSDDNE
jgi:hypothetical protein